jgi:TP901 family phage tail tape measure protein
MSELSLTIGISAAAGAAMSVFGNLRGTMQRVATVTKTLSAQQRALGLTIQNAANMPQDEIARLNAQYARQQQLINRLRANTQALGRSQAAIAANEASRGQLRGKMMETAGLAYLAAQPLRVGVEFEASMSKVQALTRLDKNSEEMRQLTEQARMLGATTSFTASEAAQAQGFLAMAGFKTTKILQSMPAMLDLAKAGDIDLQRTADIASNIQTTYGIDSSQMNRVADILAASFTNANVDLEMLSQSMKYMGPVAEKFNMSLEESAAMPGLLGNAGIQADMAGTALRGIMSKLSGPTSKQAKILKKLGISTSDAAGNMHSLPEIIMDLDKATEKMGNKEKLATIMGLFDQRAGPAMLALMGQKDKIQAAIDTVKNSEGAAARIAKIMGDNTAGALKTMQSAWEDLAISLTNTENSALRSLIESIAGVLCGVSKWVQENTVLVGWILKIIAGLLAFKIALLAIGYAGSLVALPFLHLAKIFRVFSAMRTLGMIGGLATVFPKLAAAATVAVRVFSALAWVVRGLFVMGRIAFMLHPIGAAITAITVAGGLIYTFWGPIKTFFSGLWNSITAFFTSGVGNITRTIVNWSPFGLFYRAFSTVLSWFGFDLPAKFSEFGMRIIQGIGAGLESAKAWLLERINSIAALLPDSVRSALGIASPSRVFMDIGAFTMQGLSQGLAAASAGPLAAARQIAGSLAAAGTLAMAPAQAAMPVTAAQAPTAGGAPITVNVYAAPGMDEKALAELVAQKIKEAQLTAAAHGRSRLSDSD